MKNNLWTIITKSGRMVTDKAVSREAFLKTNKDAFVVAQLPAIRTLIIAD